MENIASISAVVSALFSGVTMVTVIAVAFKWGQFVGRTEQRMDNYDSQFSRVWKLITKKGIE